MKCAVYVLLVALWVTISTVPTFAQQRALYGIQDPSEQILSLDRESIFPLASAANTTCSILQWWRDGLWQNGIRSTRHDNEEISDHWNEATNTWELTSRTVTLRDLHGNIILLQAYAWDGTEWINSNKQTQSYDAEGRITYQRSEQWIDESWTKRWQDERIFTGNQEQLTQSIWEDNQWLFRNRSTRTSIVTQTTSTRTTIISGFGEAWDGSRWVLSGEGRSRKTERFDAEGRTVELLDEIESGDLSGWVNDERRSYIYNAMGLRTMWRLETWNGTEWTPSQQSYYLYDDMGRLVRQISERWNSMGGWVSVSRINYGCSTATETEEAPTLDFHLGTAYPNPFQNTTTLSYTLQTSESVTLKIYDALGRVVDTLVDEHQTAGVYEIHFFASHLPSGIYLYQLQAGAQAASKPLVLMR